jgi:hypothetical protein
MRSRLLRVLGLGLLLLALSPLTEPFSTIRLSDLLAQDPGTPAATSLQNKLCAEQPTAALGGATPALTTDCDSAARPLVQPAGASTPVALHLQLRI